MIQLFTDNIALFNNFSYVTFDNLFCLLCIKDFPPAFHLSIQIELHDLIRAGVVGFKCFLTDSGVSEFPNVTPADLTKVFAVLNGTGTVLAVSCYAYK